MKPARFCMLPCLLAALSVAGCSAKKHEAEQKQSAALAVVKGTTLETVKSAASPETLELVGTVRSRNSAVVSTRIPGTVSVLRVREGERVKKGQLLAQLDAQENQANAALANAGIDEARHGLDEALSRKKLADTTFERYHNLFNEQAVTRQEFDTRQNEKELATQGVARAEARLKQAQAGSRAAAAVADYTQIVAPISGVITSRQAELGATVFPSQPLMTIADEGSYQLELEVPEALATRVRPGSAVQVMLEALGSSFTAKIAEVVPAIDQTSRSFTAKINLHQKGLKSGMFGRCTINTGTTVNSITVPKKALIEHGALTSLWVLDKYNIARLRLIKTGKDIAERVEILSGLSDNERVIVGGTEKVSEGARIE